MSDRTPPDSNSKADGTPEDDPLAELARIVAGEADEASGHSGQHGDAPGDSDDLDAQLAQALEGDIDHPQETAETVPQEPGREINEAVRQVMDQDLEALNEAFATPSADNEAAAADDSLEHVEHDAERQSAEDTFEDGLISALQNEIESGEPEQGGDAAQGEAGYAASQQESGAGAQTHIEDDLGAAFDNEFQQIMSGTKTPPATQPAPAPSPVIQPPVQPVQTAQVDSAAAAPDPDATARAAHELALAMEIDPEEDAPVTEPPKHETEKEVSPGDELDFGSAFAEELGLEAIDAAPGWESGDTESANAEFSNAVSNGAAAGRVSGEAYDVSVSTDVERSVPDSQTSGESNKGSLSYAIYAMVAALVIGSGAAAYGFLSGDSSRSANGEPAIIKADEGPVKVKPEDPGGRVVANQDKASYERVENEASEDISQETLISRTEEPAEISREETANLSDLPGVSASAPAPGVETNIPEKSVERLNNTDTAPPAAGQPVGNVKPRVVQTVTVKPDGTIVQNAPQTQPLGTFASSSEGDSETATSLAPANGDVPVSIAGAQTTNTIAVPQASPRQQQAEAGTTESIVTAAAPEPQPEPEPPQTQPEPAEPAPLATAAVQSEWVVQVSSQRSREAAESSYRNLRNRFSELQGREMTLQQAQVNGNTFYRVRIQTSSRSDAVDLCSSLKASGGSCFVTR